MAGKSHNRYLSKSKETRMTENLLCLLQLAGKQTISRNRRHTMAEMKVGFYGHVRQYHNLRTEIDPAIHDVLGERQLRA